MLTKEQKENFISLKIEIIDLNILAHSFIRKTNRFSFLFNKSTRHHIYEEFVALRYMENGLILHLTNLDDDSSRFSFRTTVKELNKTITDQKRRDIFNAQLKEYRRSLGYLKNNYRNHRIVHLNYNEDLNFDEFLNFNKKLYPLIKIANSIGDLIWGEKIEYEFDLGKYEGKLNFRKLTDDLKVDFGLENGF